jgi:TM2 domain-containing membrane protein YozV
MGKALVKSAHGKGGGGVGGVIPAVCSAIVPGVGQLVNGDTDKAIGVFVVAAVSGASLLGAIPLIGSVAALVYSATWLYGVADGFVQGRRGRQGHRTR